MSTTLTLDMQASTATTAKPRPGLIQRLIEARTIQAEARIRQKFEQLPDEMLARYGLSPEHIAAVRATGRIPADFWPVAAGPQRTSGR